jgi:galactan 5-O-arabinofuranosyltransferase
MTSTASHPVDVPARPAVERPARGRPSRAAVRVAVEVVAAIVFSALTSAALQQVIDGLAIPRPSFVPHALASATVVVLVAALLLVAARREWPRWGTVAAWVLLSGVTTAILSFLLHGTRLYLNGLSGDQYFRTQYLGRLATSLVPADMNYAEIPPYYPWGWFWPAARLTDLLGLEAWAAYKPLAITTMAVAGAVAFTVWSAVVRRRPAAVLALATVLVGLRLAAYEPYSWLLAAVIPPLGVVAWRALRTVVAGTAPRPTAAVLGLGVFLGISAAVYTLLTFFTGFLFVVTAAVAVAVGRPAGRSVGRAVRAAVSALVLVAVTAVPFAAPVWLPYLVTSFRHGFSAGAAQHFLPDIGALFPLPMVQPSLSGVVCTAGLAWILLAARRNEVAAALGIAVGCVYLWYLLSTLALAFGTTLLAFRVEPVLETALYCAAALGGIEVLRRLTARAGRPLVASAAAVGLLCAVGLAQSVADANRSFVDTAFTDYTPLGTTASGSADPAHAGAWADELAATIGDMTGREPADLVVLTTWYPLLAHHPYWGYQTSIAQYANPLAQFDARRAEILSWAGATGPQDLLAQWGSGPFRAPSVLVLSRADDGLHLGLTADAFPREPNIAHVDVTFRPELFADPAFATREVGPFTVVVRR